MTYNALNRGALYGFSEVAGCCQSCMGMDDEMFSLEFQYVKKIPSPLFKISYYIGECEMESCLFCCCEETACYALVAFWDHPRPMGVS